MSRPAPTDDAHVDGVSGGAALAPVLSPHRLRWFVRLRWVLIAGAALLLLLDRVLQPAFERPGEILWAVIALGSANVVWWLVSRTMKRRAPLGGSGGSVAFADAQMAGDLLVLTVLVRYTGGVESPLAIFYVFHMALGSLLLPAGHALAQGVWAALLYAGTVFGELWGLLTPHHPLLAPLAGLSLHERAGYVFLVVGCVCCGLFGTLYLTGSIAARLRERERQLEQTNEALRRSQVAIRDIQARRARFMQTAAHRLKSPLATVQTLAGLIRDGIVRSDAHATAERIVRCCEEGIAHVSELLTLGRVQDADPLRHRRAQADVGAIVAAQCEQFHTVARRAGVKLSCDVPAGVELIASVDPRDLADCIGNVIDNAVKYTPSGGSVDVRVEREPAGDRSGVGAWVVVRVADTGIGFDAESLAGAAGNQPSVFDAYRRGNNALAAGIAGSGLGLAIVRVVVEQAGGEIEVNSAPGAGTRIALKFPVGSGDVSGPAVRDTRATRAAGACRVSEGAAGEPGVAARSEPGAVCQEKRYASR